MSGWLFDVDGEPEAPFSDQDTSLEAALKAQSAAATLRATVLRHLDGCGVFGATDDEIQAALGLPGNTERPRRRELEERHMIVRTETRRKTRAGRKAKVWVHADHYQPPGEV